MPYVFECDESEVSWSAKGTDLLLVYIHYFVKGGQNLNIMTVPLPSPHALWQLNCSHQLFPLDPGNLLEADSLENGLSFRVTRRTFAIFSFSPPWSSKPQSARFPGSWLCTLPDSNDKAVPRQGWHKITYCKSMLH